MTPGATTWQMQQLVRFLVELSDAGDDEEELLERAMVAAAEAVEAELGAVVRDGRVLASIGFPPEGVQVSALVDAAARRADVLALDRAVVPALSTPLDADVRGTLLLARGGEGFTAEEAALVRGMASALTLSVRSCRLLAGERAARQHSDRQAREALRDPLTRLANRRLFFQRLAHASARAERVGRRIAILFMDLDGFKHVNDTMGHGVGDDLLVLVAQRILGVVREGDAVARLGGDEFAVLVEDLAEASVAEALAGRICAAVARPFDLGGRNVTIRASVGIALGPGAQRAHPELLLRDADVAMYRAKVEKPGAFVVFDEAMHQQVVRRLSMAEDLRTAIPGQLHLAYQPVVQLASGRIAGIEALVRWDHADRGAVPPSDFVPLAEELGIVGELGAWVLDETCRQLAEWRRHPWAEDVNVAVNVSSHQLHDPGFVALVGQALAVHRIPPGRLVVEITETAALSDSTIVVDQLAGLRRLGVPIALDDFGTGYSSLSHLSELPIDILKIDRSFVSRVTTSRRHAALTESIVRLGRELELDVVAEGIEEPAQLSAVLAMGCAYGQGYLFSRPTTPAGMATRLLAARDDVTATG